MIFKCYKGKKKNNFFKKGRFCNRVIKKLLKQGLEITVIVKKKA